MAGYNSYANNRIQTASQAELTLMLYEGAIKFANIAKMGIEEKNFEKANTNIQKAERIYEHLLMTLDPKYQVSKDFENVYRCVLQLLLDANLRKDNETLEQALSYMRDMRDTWKEVMHISKTKQS